MILTLAVTSYTIAMVFINDSIPEPKIEDVEVSFNVVSDDDMVEFHPAASIIISIEDDDCMYTLSHSMVIMVHNLDIYNVEERAETKYFGELCMSVCT